MVAHTTSKKLFNVTLRVWRQAGPNQPGKFVEYKASNLNPNMSLLEMLDVVNDDLEKKGEDPIAFAHDCREGICGMCGLVINGRPHGPRERTTTCQLHMRSFSDGDEITIAGATPAGYNITTNVSYIDANTYSYQVPDTLAATATGTITATGSTEGYFDLAYYANVGGELFDLTGEERAALETWLQADPRHRAEYDLFAHLWSASAQLKPGVGRRRRALGAALAVLAGEVASGFAVPAAAAEAARREPQHIDLSKPLNQIALPMLDQQDNQALRELPAASPFRLDALEAGLIMASAGQTDLAHARGGL